MESHEEYRVLYDNLVSNNAKIIIVKYNSLKGKYEYKPYSHTTDDDAIEKLANLIIDNMIFYAYTEEEILDLQKRKGILDDLRIAAKYAYMQRLPHRIDPNTDGTPGEILLDLLIQVYEPISQKLIARAKYRQLGDKQEIKGYDALYFTKEKDEICLWLGQVKSGTKNYCLKSIIEDLNEKYLLDYFCNSMFYVAEKMEKNDLNKIVNKINDICFDSIKYNWTNDKKKEKLIRLIQSENIKIKIPCVLTFTDSIYSKIGRLEVLINSSIKKIIDKLEINNYPIAKGLEYEIVFYVFPVKDINELRSTIVEFKKAGDDNRTA